MSNGFLYIVSGAERYFREAGDSVASLRRHNPGAHATLMTDAVPASVPDLPRRFDAVTTYPLEPTVGRNVSPHVQATTYRVRNIYRHSPYDRTCHVDSDTYFVADFQPLFELLDYFDIAIALAPADITPVRVDGHDVVACPLYNCGMITFKKSEASERLFERWRYWQDLSLDDPQSLANDQVTFMRALLDVSCRVCVVHSNWNARTTGFERFRGPVRLIHGRHGDRETVAGEINRRAKDLRAWIPKVELALYEDMSIGDQLRFVARVARVSLRRWIRGK